MRRNTSWAFAGNSVYAGCQWIVFVLLVRSLGPSDGGLFAYAVAVAGPIFVLANVRLRNLLATAGGASQHFADYFTARLVTTALGVSASFGIGALVWPDAAPLAALALMTAARACDALSDICHGLFQRELEMRSAAIGLMINGVLSVALVWITLVLFPSLTLATAAYAAGSCLALVGWDLPRQAKLADRVRPRGCARESIAAGLRLIRTSLPLGLSSAIGSAQTNLPRYVIGSVLGPAALAAFAAISYIPMIGHLGVNAASQAALPMLATEARTSRLQYRTRLFGLVGGSVAFGALALAATALLGRSALRWIYGEQYGQYVDVLFWLVASAVATFTSVFLGAGTIARLRFNAQFVISATSLAVVAVSIGPLVSGYGLNGAAWSLLAGAAVELCAYAALTASDLRAAMPAHATISGVLAGGTRP
jgi:O-antigen/teichoic acid export membrane protein